MAYMFAFIELCYRRCLKLSTLGKIFSRYIETFLLFFTENRIWHYMQIVSSGGKLQETLFYISFVQHLTSAYKLFSNKRSRKVKQGYNSYKMKND